MYIPFSPSSASLTLLLFNYQRKGLKLSPLLPNSLTYQHPHFVFNRIVVVVGVDLYIYNKPLFFYLFAVVFDVILLSKFSFSFAKKKLVPFLFLTFSSFPSSFLIPDSILEKSRLDSTHSTAGGTHAHASSIDSRHSFLIFLPFVVVFFFFFFFFFSP